MTYYIIIPVMGLMMLAGGCKSSFITSSWKAEDARAKPYTKILVLGLIGGSDRQLREKMEEHLAGDLRDLGYGAETAIRVFGPHEFQEMKEEQAISNLQDKEYDAVITIVMLDKEKERYYVPGRVIYSPYAIYQHRFWGYYSTMYDRVYAPGYYTEDSRYFWETNLFDFEDQKLVYSAQSESFTPESARSLGHEYGLMIVNDLVKNKVLEQQKPATALRSF